MAKTPIRDNTLWYSDNAFMPPEDKNALWLAQSIFFAKLNSKIFLQPQRMKEYRALEKGIINVPEYKNLIDPKNPMDKSSGSAAYFASDWKTCPIDVHLDNIVRAKLDKIGVENKIQVNQIDKFAKSQKQKDKDRVIFQREFRRLINDVNEQIGLPPIKDSQDPYSYVKSLGKDAADKMIDSVDTLVDYIRNQITDDQDLALYESYIYKGDIERAFELGIDHYLINLNKWRIKCEYFNNDLKNFNKACGRWYIDETTGRGNVQYLSPDCLFTSPFKEKNGEDILYWYYEYPITFAEFVRQFGEKLNDEQLKEVFEINKTNGASHGMSWNSAKGFKGSNANIMVGVFSVLTQDAEKFAESYTNNRVPTWTKKKLSWLPDKDSDETIKNKMYNVWYSCYYVPPPGDRTARNQMADWEWQSQYIFNIHKDIDMYRYGVDMRYAKSTLVIWQDESRMSFTDIKESFMPKIRTTWHKFQNALVQDTSGLIMDEDLFGSLLNAVDEENKIDPNNPDAPTGGNGRDTAMQMWKMLRQGGLTFGKFRDKNGQLVVQDPSKLQIQVDSKHLDKAEKYLKIILDLYKTMTLALAQNDISEGQDAKRTAIAGIQASIETAQEGIWFIEKPVREFLIMYGERCTQHILNMVKERKKYGFKQRWDEFQSVIGYANALMLEGIEDLQPEEIGLTVSLEDVTGKQALYTQLALEMAKDKQISPQDVEIITSTIEHNYKYGAVLLSLAAKRFEREQANKQMVTHKMKMEEINAERQTAIELIKAKTEGKNENTMMEGRIEAMLQQQLNEIKKQTQIAVKQAISENRKDEASHKANLEDQKVLK